MEFWNKHCSRESKSTSRVSAHSSKNKMLPLLSRKWANIIKLLLGSWLITLGNGAILGNLLAPAAGRLLVIAVHRLSLMSGSPCCLDQG